MALTGRDVLWLYGTAWCSGVLGAVDSRDGSRSAEWTFCLRRTELKLKRQQPTTQSVLSELGRTPVDGLLSSSHPSGDTPLDVYRYHYPGGGRMRQINCDTFHPVTVGVSVSVAHTF